jgi:adenine-specific DNA-methyltransferase
MSWSGEYLSYGDWLAEPRKSVPFVGERLLVRQIPSTPPYLVHGAFTDSEFYNDINSMVIFAPRGGISLKYLLGLINSRLLSMWFLKTFDKLQRRIFPQFKVKELAMFPIRTIDFSDPKDVARHARMVTLVERMLSLHERLTEAKIEGERTVVQHQIDAADRQIDQLVYALYDLTDEEIEIAEQQSRQGV